RDRPVARDEDRDLVPGAGQRFRQRGRDIGQAARLDERRELRGQEADVEASLRHGDRSRLARLDAAPSAGVLFRETRHKERHMRRAAAVFVLGLTMQATLAFAGETGSVSGVVKDSQGGVLPGVTVKVSGVQMPGGRVAHTAGSGTYNFENLIPGVYRVEAELPGMGTAAREVRV